MFGRATIRLGIGPHSSSVLCHNPAQLSSFNEFGSKYKYLPGCIAVLVLVLRTQMRPIVADREAWSVRRSVCLSVGLSQ